jgi:hypothetical protein
MPRLWKALGSAPNMAVKAGLERTARAAAPRRTMPAAGPWFPLKDSSSIAPSWPQDAGYHIGAKTLSVKWFTVHFSG